MRLKAVVLAVLLFGTAAFCGDRGALPLLGHTEYVVVAAKDAAGKDVTFATEAKIDTGADSAALHGLNVDRFRRGKRNWVRFTVATVDDQVVQLEAPLVKMVRVRSSNGERARRYVVELQLCLGNRWVPVSVSLTDRSKMSCPLLLGQKFLSNRYLVDVGQSHIQGKPSCP